MLGYVCGWSIVMSVLGLLFMDVQNHLYENVENSPMKGENGVFILGFTLAAVNFALIIFAVFLQRTKTASAAVACPGPPPAAPAGSLRRKWA